MASIRAAMLMSVITIATKRTTKKLAASNNTVVANRNSFGGVTHLCFLNGSHRVERGNAYP
jgi:hypothetical protein